MEMENQKKLNIAIVCDPITDYVAGSFVSALRFAELLKDRGHKVIFIAAKSPHNNGHKDYYNGIKAYRFASILLPKTEKQLYISFPTEGQIKKILEEEEIDILHNIIPTPSSIVATKAAKSLEIKVVTHSHSQPENVFLHLPKMMPKETLNRAFYKFMYWLYHQAEAIVYPTEFAKRLFPDLNQEIKTAVISNGVDTNRFKKIDATGFFEKYNLDKAKKHLLFVGRFHPEKSIDTLIKAVPNIIAQSPNTHIVLAGSGHQEEAMKKLATSLNLDEYITFCGKVSDEDLILAYNVADVFVLTSLAELEGMVVLEAMACGKPLLIADAKDSASVYLVEGNGLLFKAEDYNDLAEKAVQLLNNEALLKTMSEKSSTLSREYDINRSVDKLLDLYYSIL